MNPTHKYYHHCRNNPDSNNDADFTKIIASRYIKMQQKQLKFIGVFSMYLILIIVNFVFELPHAHFITANPDDDANVDDKFVVPYLDNICEYFSKFVVCTYKAYLLMTYKGHNILSCPNATWQCPDCCKANIPFIRRLCDGCFANNPHSYYPAFRWTLQITSISINGCIKISMRGENEFDRQDTNIWTSELFGFGILIYKKAIFTTNDEKDNTGCFVSKRRYTQVQIVEGDIIQIGIHNNKLIMILRGCNNNRIKKTLKWLIPTIKYRLYLYTSNPENEIRMINFQQIQ